MEYDFRKIEKKWQQRWEREKIYEVKEDPKKDKFYCLIEFPYPSGEGLHVGHPRSYTALDIVARKKRMQGKNVLYPIGWDAFGLPTENYAIKTGIQPAVATEKNVKNFTRQLKSLGFSFDWSREINTTDPKYYKWTQWMFLQFFKHGLAYKDKIAINWCTKCKIGLANEEVVNGVCERCGGTVEKRMKEQWMIKITKYAERLLEGLKNVDYSPRIKEGQINWIGKSEGAEVDFRVVIAIRQPAEKQSHKDGIAASSHQGGTPRNDIIKVFTTRPDTLFGATYMVLAPEHEMVGKLKSQITNWNDVEKYIDEAKRKSDLERTMAWEKAPPQGRDARISDRIEDSEKFGKKTGVELKGIKAVNPANNEEIPIWVADYVLTGYGTGAIMAVPAHDERDFAFAKKFGLSIREVVIKKFGERRSDAVRRDGVAGVVLNKDKKVLVLHDKKYDIYRLPAGGYEKNETPEEVLHREIQEESGYVNIKIEEFLGTIEANFDIIFRKVYRHKFQKGYLVRLLGDEQGEMDEEGKEIFEKMWLDYGEAMKRFAKNKESWGEEEFIRRVFEPKEKCFAGNGTAVNSDFLDGLSTGEAKEKITKWLEEKNIGKKTVNYKLRDWVFSRQRYWGEPIPLVYCEKCGWQPVPEKDLPVELPKVKKYEPTDTGESPLAAMEKWVKTKCPKCGGEARRETDTMPNWAGSSWYFLRYTDPKNKKEFASGKNLKYWMSVSGSPTPPNLPSGRGGSQFVSPPFGGGAGGGVDWYNGGMEHNNLHLLYSRFWYKFLYDIGVVPKECGDEPYKKRTSHGLILGEGGEKMSKSRGNVVNPDDIVARFGADTLRVYEMFTGPFEQAIPWDEKGVVGVFRFLERVWRLQEKVSSSKYKVSSNLERLINQTIKKVGEDIEQMKFNTAVSALMILTNEMAAQENLPITCYQLLITLLAPFAPHMAEELWEKMGSASSADKNKKSIHLAEWPKHDPALIVEEEIDLIIQVNGKMRDSIRVKADISEEEAKKIATESEKVKKWIDGQKIKKLIFVKGRLVNIVV